MRIFTTASNGVRPLTLCAALLLALGPAAASGTAATDTLRTADQALNATYRDVMSRLSPENRRELLAAQRSWLAFRDATCALEADPDHPAGRMACLDRMTRARTRKLRDYGRVLTAATTPESAATSSPSADAVRNGPTMGCDLGPLPGTATVQAVGLYEGGLDTDVQLDPSSETRAADVVVNLPGQDVVLVLMAYDPVLWTVKRTPGTRLAAVIVGGYYAQGVLGVERALPLAVTTHQGPRKDCGGAFYAYEAGPSLLAADQRVHDIVGRAIDRLWSSYSGSLIHVGRPPAAGTALIAAPDYRPEDYTDLPRFPSGQRGLDALLAQGLLRRATVQDLDAWVEAASAPYRRFDPGLRVDRPTGASGIYVVQGPMRFPTGLYGAHSASFLLPAGLPMPTGNPGHSSVYLIEDGGCRGPSCPQHR